MNIGEDELKERIWEQLKTVLDPELHIDVVNLGLIYDVKIVPSEELDGKFDVNIDMTLTSPGCTMGPYIGKCIFEAVDVLDSVDKVNVDVVWDPPWTNDKISEEGKMELGLI